MDLTEIAARARASRIPRGLWLQPWMDAGSFRHDAFLAFLARAPRLGFKGVILHMGPALLQLHWDSWSTVYVNHGLLAAAVIPGDDQTALDGSLQTAADKGRLLARIANRPNCVFTGGDFEGAWGTDTGPTDQSTKPKALEFGRAFRADAPDKILITQGWWKPSVHNEHPNEEFAQYADEDFDQVYGNDYPEKGPLRNELVMAEHLADCAKFDATHPATRARPRGFTFQGYGYRGCADASVDRVLAYADDAPVILYCEPLPEPAIEAACERRMLRLAAGKALAP